MDIQQALELLDAKKDTECKHFNEKLIASAYPIQGVRVPFVRLLAKEFIKENLASGTLSPQEAREKLKSITSQFVPKTYEQVLFLGFLLSFEKDINALMESFTAFLPLIDNWAVCDMVVSSLKIFKKHREEVLCNYQGLATSPQTFHRRVLAVMLMDFFLCDEYIDKALQLLVMISNGEYYVDMAVAWAFATAAINYFDKVYEIISSDMVSDFLKRKTINKAVESFRIKDENKNKLKQLRKLFR
jgi:3-methyladenine DNA glycosylase AlkD